jgi:hypothetical protein
MRKQSGGVAALKEIQDENPLLEYSRPWCAGQEKTTQRVEMTS